MRTCFPWSCGLVGVALLATGSFAVEPEAGQYTFRTERTVGGIDRIESALDVGGELKFVESSKVQRHKMSVVAQLTYDERSLEFPAGDKGRWRSVRYYDKAAAAIQVETDGPKPALRDQRRLIGVAIKGPEVALFSPNGPLTREELDLVDLLGNSLLMDRLLPDRPVKPGDKWEHPADLMAALLGLDAVSKTDVSSVLLTVTEERARFELNGHVSGAIDGVTTELELKAKYHFDRQSNRVVWFGLLVQEDRSIGHVGPGLEVTARLQIKITPGSTCAQLSDAALAGLTLEPTPELTALAYKSPRGGWEFVHDRRWHITGDEDKLAVLRMIDRGEFLAQCKVTSLAAAAPGKEVTLAKFQEDIKHGLGKSFKQFVEAGQSSNEQDYRIYRVVVEGEASDLPIRWIYYYIGDRHGRQIVFAFTLEGRLAEAFGQADLALLRSLRLTDPQMAAKPAGKQ